jgi:hypothetical protein
MYTKSDSVLGKNVAEFVKAMDKDMTERLAPAKANR